MIGVARSRARLSWRRSDAVRLRQIRARGAGRTERHRPPQRERPGGGIETVRPTSDGWIEVEAFVRRSDPGVMERTRRRRHRDPRAKTRGEATRRSRGRRALSQDGLSSPRMKRPCVYIMASNRNETLYVGVTSDVARRAAEHRAGAIKGFTKRYGCKLLALLEPHERMDEAIAREEQIKSGSRKDKLALIERDNPLWNDLYETLNA